MFHTVNIHWPINCEVLKVHCTWQLYNTNICYSRNSFHLNTVDLDDDTLISSGESTWNVSTTNWQLVHPFIHVQHRMITTSATNKNSSSSRHHNKTKKISWDQILINTPSNYFIFRRIKSDSGGKCKRYWYGLINYILQMK